MAHSILRALAMMVMAFGLLALLYVGGYFFGTEVHQTPSGTKIRVFSTELHAKSFSLVVRIESWLIGDTVVSAWPDSDE